MIAIHCFFAKIDKHPKMLCDCKSSRISKTIIKKNKAEELTFADGKGNQKVTGIKTACYWRFQDGG
jgi:hypothetical protein